MSVQGHPAVRMVGVMSHSLSIEVHNQFAFDGGVVQLKHTGHRLGRAWLQSPCLIDKPMCQVASQADSLVSVQHLP